MTKRAAVLLVALILLLVGGGFSTLRQTDGLADGVMAFFDGGMRHAEAAATPERAAFKGFFAEAQDVNRAVGCAQPRFIAGDELVGELYSCVLGEARTAKVFINAHQGKESIANIKVMWNDWHRDEGWGTHADETEAFSALADVVDLYAPELTDAAILAFMSDTPVEFISGPYYMRYRVNHGPAINERLLTIEAR
jgi:hypothetical protein